jgi:hypothetical protein
MFSELFITRVAAPSGKKKVENLGEVGEPAGPQEGGGSIMC